MDIVVVSMYCGEFRQRIIEATKSWFPTIFFDGQRSYLMTCGRGSVFLLRCPRCWFWVVSIIMETRHVSFVDRISLVWKEVSSFYGAQVATYVAVVYYAFAIFVLRQQARKYRDVL
jgi:hypothetical protein